MLPFIVRTAPEFNKKVTQKVTPSVTFFVLLGHFARKIDTNFG